MSSSRDQRKQLYERLVGQPVASGRFVVTKLLGFGGMGAVYEAVQTNMNRKVALKLIPTHDPTIVARFEREAHTISRLQHPNTITVFDFGQSEDGFLFLSMELLEGVTLTDAIKQGPMAPKRAVHIATQMCRSLAEAHRAGIVHRDIKPDNIILIRVDDDPDVAKVLDFGIAKAVMGEDDVQLTGDGRIIGTPRYMSPEQILAERLDHRSDIYSLGCILFEMLCGAPPFQQSSTTALMISHTQDPPPSFSAQLDTGMMALVPPGLERVVRRALAKSPDDRPADCDVFREELEAAMKGMIIRDPNEGPETVAGLPVHHTVGRPAAMSQAAATAENLVAPSSGGSGKALMVAIVALLLVIVGLVALRPTETPAPAPQPEPPVTAEKPPEPKPEPKVEEPPPPKPVEPGVAIAMINIASQPSGARLYEGDAFLGTTPVEIPVKAELNKYSYRLVLDGHEDLTVVVPISPMDKDQDVIREFKLQPTKAPRPVTPRAKDPKPKQPTQPAETSEATKATKPDVRLLDDGPTANVPIIE